MTLVRVTREHKVLSHWGGRWVVDNFIALSNWTPCALLCSFAKQVQQPYGAPYMAHSKRSARLMSFTLFHAQTSFLEAQSPVWIVTRTKVSQVSSGNCVKDFAFSTSEPRRVQWHWADCCRATHTSGICFSEAVGSLAQEFPIKPAALPIQSSTW